VGCGIKEDVQSNRETEEPLFGGSILCTFVYLFPESELVVSTAVEIIAKWDTGHAVEHEICQLENSPRQQ